MQLRDKKATEKQVNDTAACNKDKLEKETSTYSKKQTSEREMLNKQAREKKWATNK